MNEANTTPGEFVTDDLGRIIISYSSLKAFRACRRKYWWRYLRHVVPLGLKAGDPRELGKACHAAREGLSRGMNVDDLLVAFWGDTDRNHKIFEEAERSRAMMRNYRRRWGVEGQADLDGEWTLLETKFVGDIEDPRTGQVHQKYCAGGKCDGALLVKEPRMWGDFEIEPGQYLYELKTAASINGDYISKLWLDFQILWYSHYIEDGLGVPLKGVLYDIVEKTKLGHTTAETDAEFEARKEELMGPALAGQTRKSEKGGTIKQRTTGKNAETEEEFHQRCVDGSTKWIQSTLKQREREPDQAFRDRLDASYSKDAKFHREVVPISAEHRKDIRVNVWELLWQHDEAEAREHWGKNEDQCFGFFRPCDYLPICKSLDSQIEIDNNYRLKPPHSEQVESDLPIVP